MDNQKKEEYIRILTDVNKEVETWDWDEDYYNSGLKDREDRIDWTQTRLDEMIKIIESL